MANESFSRAITAIKHRKYHNAIDHLNETLKLKSNCVEAYIRKSLCMYMLEQYEKSIDSLDVALKILPNCVDALIFKGFCFNTKGSRKEAKIFFQKAENLNRNPEDQQKILIKGIGLMGLQRYDEAEVMFKKLNLLTEEDDFKRRFYSKIQACLKIDGIEYFFIVKRVNYKDVELYFFDSLGAYIPKFVYQLYEIFPFEKDIPFTRASTNKLAWKISSNIKFITDSKR